VSLPVVAVERAVRASPTRVFDLLANPLMHPVIDGSGSVRKITSTDARLAKGSTFGADMRIGLPYRVTNTVVELEEDRRIAWRHFAGHRWRYVLTPLESGTLVREEWDASRLAAPVQQFFKIVRFPQRSRRAMVETLRRLAVELDGTADPS
jgi:hypothetical protein